MAYVCKNDVCTARDIAQVGVFKGLQRAINDVLAASAAADENTPGEISHQLVRLIDPVPVTGKLDAKTAETANFLALNIKSVRQAFEGIILDLPNVAKHADQLGRWFAFVAEAQYKSEAIPKWAWPLSPAAAYAWARRAYRGK